MNMKLASTLQSFSKSLPKSFSKMTGLGTKNKSRSSTKSQTSAHSAVRADNSLRATSYSIKTPTERRGGDVYDGGHRSRGFADSSTRSGTARAGTTRAHLPLNVHEAYEQHVAEHERDGYIPQSFTEFKEKFQNQHAPKVKKHAPAQVSHQQLAEAQAILKKGKPQIPYHKWELACQQAANDGYDPPSLQEFLGRDEGYAKSLHQYQQAAKAVETSRKQSLWNTPSKSSTPSRQEITDAKAIVSQGPPGELYEEYDKVAKQYERDGYSAPSFQDFSREHRARSTQFKKAQQTLQAANQQPSSHYGSESQQPARSNNHQRPASYASAPTKHQRTEDRHSRTSSNARTNSQNKQTPASARQTPPSRPSNMPPPSRPAPRPPAKTHSAPARMESSVKPMNVHEAPPSGPSHMRPPSRPAPAPARVFSAPARMESESPVEPMSLREAYEQHVAEHERDGYMPLTFNDFKKRFQSIHGQNAPKAQKPTSPQPTTQQVADARATLKKGKPQIPYSRWDAACRQAINDGYDPPTLENFLRGDHQYTNDMVQYQQAAKLAKQSEDQALHGGGAATKSYADQGWRQEVEDAKAVVQQGRPGNVREEYNQVARKYEMDGYPPPSFSDFSREHGMKVQQFERAQKTLAADNDMLTAHLEKEASAFDKSKLTKEERSRFNNFMKETLVTPDEHEDLAYQAELTFKRVLSSPPDKIDRNDALRTLEKAIVKGDYGSLSRRMERINSFLDR